MSGLFRTPRLRPAALLVSLLSLALCGCGDHYPSDLRYPLRTDLLVVGVPTATPFYPYPPGHLDDGIAQVGAGGGETLDPRKIAGGDRGKLRGELQRLFGTPAAPKVEAGDDDELKAAVEKLQLAPQTLADGSRLYRRHCLHCHGLAGDGRGPTGPWVSPHPRDYRRGKFKFISTHRDAPDKEKPRRDDLVRTIRMGIDGTTMPSFSLLAPAEIEQLASYVIHLSLRGQVEFVVMQGLLKGGLTGDDIADDCEKQLKTLAGYWVQADRVEEPKPYPYRHDPKLPPAEDPVLRQSIERGYALFTNPEGAASCIKCHEDFGRQVPFRYDDWGTLVRPADLTTGVYRGGRRPIDLYWRIRLGIISSQMPGANLQDNEYWDVVNFVQALPYPQMLPEKVRHRIYPEPPPPGARTSEHAAAHSQ